VEAKIVNFKLNTGKLNFTDLCGKGVENFKFDFLISDFGPKQVKVVTH
jgi:hypothetical protein